MYPMEPEVAVLVDQTFQTFVRDLHVDASTISLARCVGDGVNTPSGTKILFRDPPLILGVHTTNDNHLLVGCVVIVVVCVVVVVVSSSR